LPGLAPGLAAYSLTDSRQIDNQPVSAQEMVLLPGSAAVSVRAGDAGARLVVIGGAPLEQPVRMWWNFVATDRSRLAAAATRWEQDGFPAIPGETDRIPAPQWVG